MNRFGYSDEQLEENLTNIFALEFLGIRVEDVKEVRDMGNIDFHLSYYFSVPEKLDIKECKLKIPFEFDFNTEHKSDDLIELGKEIFSRGIIDSCKDVYGQESELDEDFINELEGNLSSYAKFYAKVREGEVWTSEMGYSRLEELLNEIHSAGGYKEV